MTLLRIFSVLASTYLSLFSLSQTASAQSACPSIATGAVLTAAQWNACFQAKQNTLGYTPVNRAGDTMLGKLTTAASQTSGASLNLPQGQVPSAPQNGDIWTTISGLYVRINGATIGPLTAVSPASFAGVPPLSVTFPAGIVTYALSTDANFSIVANELTLASGGIAYPSGVTGGAKGAGTINASGLYISDVAVVAGGISSLTGDVTGVGPGAVATTLATVNPNVGSFGSSTAIPSFTVNGKGLITAVSTNAVIAPAGTLTGTTLASNVVTSSLTSVGALGGGSATTGFTISAGNVTWSGQIPGANVVPVANASGSPSATFGVMKGDGTTIQCSAGVCSAVGGVASSVQIGVTTITSGTTSRVLYDNSGVLGEYSVSGSGNVAMTTSPSFTTPTLGAATATSINGLTITSSTGTLTVANGKTLTASNSITFAGTDSTTMTFPSTSATITQTIASGAKALATGAIGSASCTTAQTDTATGALTSDTVSAIFSADPTAVTGYIPATSGMLTIIPWLTANTVNFKVCNNTLSSITPGAVTINWRVTR